MIRFTLGAETLTARQGPNESPSEAVARSIARRVKANSVRLVPDSEAANGSYDVFQYTALARFDQKRGGAAVIDSGFVTIFR